MCRCRCQGCVAARAAEHVAVAQTVRAVVAVVLVVRTVVAVAAVVARAVDAREPVELGARIRNLALLFCYPLRLKGFKESAGNAVAYKLKYNNNNNNLKINS